jgi:hypothetical protein
MERQFIAEQVALFSRLYPHLAASTSNEQVPRNERPETEREGNQEPADNNEFDREDVLGETTESTPSEPRGQTSSISLREQAEEEEEEVFDPKTASARAPMTYNALCRFRRRCAPILLASSPRASYIIFSDGSRYQIDSRRCQLVPFLTRPPRYDAHAKLTGDKNNKADPSSADSLSARRPSLARGASEASHWSNASTDVEAEDGGEASSLHTIQSGYEASQEELDRIDTVSSTTETTLVGKGKAKATIPVTIKKVSASPLKPLARGYDDAETGMALVAHTPVLV